MAVTTKPKRQVLVDETVAFDQPSGSVGELIGGYTHLQLPQSDLDGAAIDFDHIFSTTNLIYDTNNLER